MVSRPITRFRNTAATLLSVSAVSRIAQLWFQDIDPAALWAAVIGALYLIVGIGLYGQSRFVLFLSILMPAAGVWLALRHNTLLDLSELGLAQIIMESCVIVLSAAVLFAVRKNPSV